MTADMVAGDTGTVLRVNCERKSDGTPINLNGASVDLHWLDANGVLATRSMSIIDAPNGVVAYQFQADELYPHLMSFEVEITDAVGAVLKNVELIKQIVREAVS